ncbi:DUF3224 domain-containing protein [Ottowia oryzae]|uniref:Uncharacterized protein n=1 Tax=Ottowia oryzae TaxID=2109914 RepID=A0A2S0MFN9_9BURK|nr:hypothetical protein C6570_10075 [Ottowia oryzae]
MSLDKRFEGDLVAFGKGEMLTALTPIKGSAGYVAIEWVTETLQATKGASSFCPAPWWGRPCAGSPLSGSSVRCLPSH